jgi:YaiO family outer membrane protein
MLNRFIFRILAILGIFLLALTGAVSAQSKGDTAIVINERTDIDALFKQAREISFAGNNLQARRILQRILERKPDYYDVRTFLGRTYAWDRQYDNARTELSRVLIDRENDQDALLALIDVEDWSGNPEVANQYLRLGLSYYPTSEALLMKKARLQIKADDKESAAITLRRILDFNPGNKEAIDLMNSLNTARLNNRVQVSYTVDFFDKKNSPWQFISADIGRSFKFGSVIMRGNVAERFSNRGLQYEVESFLRLFKGNYVNAAVAFSTADQVFPGQRYSAEMFQKLPLGFEISGGMRYLEFTDGTTIYTGSLGNYFRDYWIAFRAFITPKPGIITTENSFFARTSQTFIFNIRKYTDDADNFLGLRAGRGDSPDERRVIDATTPRLRSWSGDLEFQRRAFGRWIVRTDIGYAYEEIRKDTYQQRITLGLQLRTNF